MEEQNRFFLNYGKVFNWINTKFSAFVYHMSGLNWTKNFSHCSISGPVAPSSMPKLKTPLATIFVKKNCWKKFWWGSRPNWVTPWKEFVISWKKWRFEIFRTSQVSSYLSPLWPSALQNKPLELEKRSKATIEKCSISLSEKQKKKFFDLRKQKSSEL